MKITYTITIAGMRESQMRPILAALQASKLTYELQAHVDGEHMTTVNKRANGKLGRVNPGTRIMLGARRAEFQEGSLSEQIVQLIEKHEKKNGPGSLTRAELTEQLSEYSDAPAAAIGSALKKDIIRGIADG